MLHVTLATIAPTFSLQSFLRSRYDRSCVLGSLLPYRYHRYHNIATIATTVSLVLGPGSNSSGTTY